MRTIANAAGAAYYRGKVGDELTAEMIRQARVRSGGKRPPAGSTRQVTAARRGQAQAAPQRRTPVEQRRVPNRERHQWQRPTITGSGMILEIAGARHELPGSNAVSIVWMAHGDAAWVLDRRTEELRVMTQRFAHVVERKGLPLSIALRARVAHFTEDGTARYRQVPPG